MEDTYPELAGAAVPVGLVVVPAGGAAVVAGGAGVAVPVPRLVVEGGWPRQVVIPIRRRRDFNGQEMSMRNSETDWKTG